MRDYCDAQLHLYCVSDANVIGANSESSKTETRKNKTEETVLGVPLQKQVLPGLLWALNAVHLVHAWESLSRSSPQKKDHSPQAPYESWQAYAILSVQNSVSQSLHSYRSSNLPVELLLMHHKWSSIHTIRWLPQADLGLAEYARVSCCALVMALKSIRIDSMRSENHQACKLI